MYHLILGENASKKNKAIVWDGECDEAFQKLKGACTFTPIPSICQFYETVQIAYRCLHFGSKANPVLKSR